MHCLTLENLLQTCQICRCIGLHLKGEHVLSRSQIFLLFYEKKLNYQYEKAGECFILEVQLKFDSYHHLELLN